MRLIRIGLNNSYKLFEIADSTYLINYDYKEISHLLLDKPIVNHPTETQQSEFDQLIFKDKALIGDEEFLLEVKSNKNHSFNLTINQHRITVNKKSIITDSNHLPATLLFGPALILNLALNEVFCFHASSFEYKDCVFILFAKSGTGKSTIADYFQQKFKSRIADDIVALNNREERINVLPSFPQLKLPPEQQANSSLINKSPILLFAQQSNESTQLKELNKFISIKSAIHHSVASKLFSPSLLNNHLSFCHLLAQQTKAFELKYQHSQSSLDQLCGLFDDLV
jgi:hypothetical protein